MDPHADEAPGYIKGDVNYKKVAEEVYFASDTARMMKEPGYAPPGLEYHQPRGIRQ